MTTNTVMQQGSFTSTGVAVTLQIRSGIDWMRVYNTTQMAANQTTAVGVKYYWQKGMANFTALADYHAAASSALSASVRCERSVTFACSVLSLAIFESCTRRSLVNSGNETRSP